jgi:hypothetical protein
MFSALLLNSDIAQCSWHILKVPLTDSCTAAITGLFDHLIGALRYSMQRKIAADGEDAARRTRNVVKTFRWIERRR